MQSKIQEHRDKYKAYKKEYNVVIKTVKPAEKEAL
jgi:hypothetical protein